MFMFQVTKRIDVINGMYACSLSVSDLFVVINLFVLGHRRHFVLFHCYFAALYL